MPALAKDRHRLADEEKSEVNKWLDVEFFRKNWNLAEEKMGLHLIDRPPLDPLAFTSRSLWRQRAQELLKAIAPGESGRSVQGGHVVLLVGEPGELQARIIAQNKKSTTKTLEENQDFLQVIYKMPGVTTIDTRTLTPSEVVRQIAGIIHLMDYQPADLDRRLNELANPAQQEFDFSTA